MRGVEGSHGSSVATLGDSVRGLRGRMKLSKGIGKDEGCISAAVARARVSCRGDGERGDRCLLESCEAGAMGRKVAAHRICAGQSHGSVNCSHNCVGDRKASRRSFRRAARASILVRIGRN